MLDLVFLLVEMVFKKSEKLAKTVLLMFPLAQTNVEMEFKKSEKLAKIVLPIANIVMKVVQMEV